MSISRKLFLVIMFAVASCAPEPYYITQVDAEIASAALYRFAQERYPVVTTTTPQAKGATFNATIKYSEFPDSKDEISELAARAAREILGTESGGMTLKDKGMRVVVTVLPAIENVDALPWGSFHMSNETYRWFDDVGFRVWDADELETESLARRGIAKDQPKEQRNFYQTPPEQPRTAVVLPKPAPPPPMPTYEPMTSGSSSGPSVYVTDTGNRYHRGNCRHAQKSGRPTSLSHARSLGLTPCRVCKP